MEGEMSGESLAIAEAAGRPWGTWEELVLGGAVLRHGATDWTAVAAELRLRFPYPFTPQECEAKYEDVQERFSSFDAWFEELRRRRVEELRRQLEKSEDSIGSLELKLESLKVERQSDQCVDYDSRHTESPYPTENAEGIDVSCKEHSFDRSSAGSFIEETRSVWSPEPQIADSIGAQGKDINVEASKDSTWNMFIIRGDTVVVPGNLRKKRGTRKRRFQNDIREGSIGVSSSGCSLDVKKEESREFSYQKMGRSRQGPGSEDSGCRSVGRHRELEGILDALMKHKGVSFLGRQLESQKKARYRKMIRRHVDFQIIKSRISDGSISSVRELFRDLLLLCNNAVVFYPKYSREYKYALNLRELVTRRVREEQGPSRSSSVVEEESRTTKPEAREPCEQKTAGSEPSSGKVATAKKAEDSKKASGVGATPTSPPKKRKVGRPAKNPLRGQRNPTESPPNKGRKKVKR